jgi:hypothetical protein
MKNIMRKAVESNSRRASMRIERATLDLIYFYITNKVYGPSFIKIYDEVYSRSLASNPVWQLDWNVRWNTVCSAIDDNTYEPSSNIISEIEESVHNIIDD